MNEPEIRKDLTASSANPVEILPGTKPVIHRRRPLLRDLLSDMTEDNLHDPVDFGPPVGQEDL